MHYHAEIWLPTASNIGPEVAALMEPHRENSSGPLRGFWDWYQIGGRYTGAHTPSYEPEKDPANIETCKQCSGSGFRSDEIGRRARENDPTYTCNGCGAFVEGKGWTHGEHGPGKCTKWPTQWRRYDGDILPVEAVSPELTAYTLIASGTVLHKEEWTGKEWKDTDFDGRVLPALEMLGLKGGVLVTVDYHS